MRKLKHVLIYPGLSNILLIKEIGMIPFYLQKDYKIESHILSYNNEKYSNLKYCNGVNLELLKKEGNNFLGLNLNSGKAFIKFLISNAKNIDILTLIHLNEENIRFGALYKFLNKRGFLYLKLDTTIDVFKTRKSLKFSKKKYQSALDFLNSIFLKNLYRYFFQKLDLMSAETYALKNYISKNHPSLQNKVIYIPNGVNDQYIEEQGLKNISFSQKENIILTVGRIGAYEKSNETLLNAILKIKDLKDWKIYFVGPVKKRFEIKIKNFFKEHPELKKKVIFTGKISDLKKLYNLYKKSKIFCLTSRHESFGIVLVEAVYFGNYIVSTDILSAREITKNGTYGDLFSVGNPIELAKILEFLINNEEKIRTNFKRLIKSVRARYSWTEITKNLYCEIIKRI